MEVKKTAFPLGGKYRDIVIAAGLFVVFDLFVLVLNFYTSFEIAEDATAINLAGRQRMLSQRMTKNLLQTATAQDESARERALNELNATYDLFGTTFTAFKNGGGTRNTDGNAIDLIAVADPAARATLEEAEAIWQPLHAQIHTLIEHPNNAQALQAALALANNNNLGLLGLMNDLTTRLAVLAQEKARRLRMYQSIGISLALINFILLLFHFLRKLNRSDAATEAARKETGEILDTVSEGFFLVDADLNLGRQHSSAMERIFRREIKPGSPFLALLEGKVSQQTLDTAREYIKLLFTKRVRENLATDLNPLVKLEIDLNHDAQGQDIHYLNIGFKRVQGGEGITHLLGSVTDITEQVRLEHSLEAAQSRAKEEMELLSQILQGNPLHMREYLDETRRLLLNINALLEKSRNPQDHRHIIEQSLPAAHKAKGDASALGNSMFTGMLHAFEETLKTAQAQSELRPDDLLPVTIHINAILAKINTIAVIIDKIARLIPTQDRPSAPPRSQQWREDLQQLTARVAGDLNKRAQLKLTQTNLDLIVDEDARRLREVCIQMIRNAIAHGIEPPSQRTASQKPPQGTVSISLLAAEDQTELVIKDDGAGLSLARIKHSLIEKGHYTRAQLDEMDGKSIIMSIFNTGVSTADESNEHAGRGVGMDIVKQALNALGGRMQIGSRPGRYTEFHFTFSNVRIEPGEGVIAA